MHKVGGRDGNSWKMRDKYAPTWDCEADYATITRQSLIL